VMVAPTVSIYVDSSEESFKDTIDIRVDVTHPVPVASAVFPAATIVELRALRDRIEIAEVEKATLRATIRTMGAVETSLRNRIRDERQTRIEIERQLALILESHRQDREDFKKLKDFMTSQCGYRS
ncbi:hypothetical protein Tco_1374673, partial [Tanacetum coccineum]